MSGAVTPSRQLAYPTRCYLIGVYMIVSLIVGIVGIAVVHLNAVPIRSALMRAHIMCALFGGVGASVAAIRKYYRALITEATAHSTGQIIEHTNWSWGWIFYYLSRPFLGGVLGALAYTLSFVGLSILTEPLSMDISTKGRYVLYAISFVSGFSVSHVLDRLNAVARQVFKADKAGN